MSKNLEVDEVRDLLYDVIEKELGVDFMPSWEDMDKVFSFDVLEIFDYKFDGYELTEPQVRAEIMEVKDEIVDEIVKKLLQAKGLMNLYNSKRVKQKMIKLELKE